MTLEISVELTKAVACELAFARHYSDHLQLHCIKSNETMFCMITQCLSNLQLI